MSNPTLQASARSAFGKGPARRLRSSGQIPAIVYRDGATPINVAVDPTILTAIYRKAGTENAVVSIEVDGAAHQCIVKESQRHPLTRAITHVDFYEVNPEVEVRITVEVVLSGKAKGMEVGGKCEQFMRSVRMACLPKDIPARFPIDITPLEINQFLRLSNLTPPPGCRLLYKVDANVVGILSGRTATEEAAEGGEAKAKA